jgi:membrane protein implicated in regulation of membrane protease activity
MKILSTWTGVLIVLMLAVAMGAVGVYQYSTGQRATGVISAAVLLVVAVLLSRRILRRTR